MANRKLVVEIIGDSNSLSNSFRKSSKELQRFGVQVNGIGRSVAKGLGFAAAGVGVLAFSRSLADSVKSAGNFELALQKMVGLSGVAQGAIKGLRNDVLALAPVVGKGPQELAEALFFITSSGIPAAKALDVLTVSAKASVAGLGETQTVADAVTSALNAYGPAALNASQATDVLVATVREGKGEADQFAGVIGNVAAIASELGVSFDQVGAALASMTRLGVDAETASVQLQQVFNALLNTSPQVAKAFKNVGLDIDGLRADLKSSGDILPILQRIKTAFGDNTAELRRAIPEIRAFRGVLALVGKQAEPVRAIFERLAKSTGSLGEAFNAVTKTQAQQFAELNASLEVFKITVGAALAPSIKSVLDPLTKWLAQTKNQKQVQKELTDTVRSAVDAVRGFVDAVKPMAQVAKQAADNVGGLKNAVELLVIALVAGKILNFAGAITGLSTQALVATGRVGALRLALLKLGAIGIITLGVEVLLNKEKIDNAVQKFLRGHGLSFLATETIKIPVDADLGALIKTRNRIAAIKGEGDLLVKALDKVIQRLDTIDHAGFVDQPGLRTRTSTTKKEEDVKTEVKVNQKKSEDNAKKAARAAANAAKRAFETTLGKLDIAFAQAGQTASLKDDLAVLQAQERVIRARLAITKNDLDLQRQLVDVQGQQLALQKQINENKIAAKNARQFEALGLTADGSARVPSSQALLKRAGTLGQQIKGTILDTPKTRSRLAQIAKVLSGAFGKVGADVRAAILQMLNDIAGSLDDGGGKKGPLTKFAKRGVEGLTAGLGLTADQVKELRQRFAQQGAGGTVPRKGVSVFGFPAVATPGGTFVIENHVILDGREISSNTTRHQQKASGRSSASRRGVRPGIGGR